MNAPSENTSGMNPTHYSSDTEGPEPLQVFANVLLALTILLILVLNPLSLLVLCKTNSIQETTKMFMVSLTISDIGSGITSAVPQLTASIPGKWVLGGFLCSMSIILGPSFILLSVSSLLVLTVDRYIAIVHSLHYNSMMTTKRAKIIIAVVWGLAATENVIMYGFSTPTKSYEKNTYFCLIIECSFCDIIYILNFAIPLVLVLILYLRILKIARDQARRIAAQNPAGNPQDGQNALQPINTKPATTVIIITGAVSVCWIVPVILNPLVKARILNAQNTLFTFLTCVVYTNCWLNVVIYYWRNNELRRAFRDLRATCHR